jgi:hypothetical protein
VVWRLGGWIHENPQISQNCQILCDMQQNPAAVRIKFSVRLHQTLSGDKHVTCFLSNTTALTSYLLRCGTSIMWRVYSSTIYEEGGVKKGSLVSQDPWLGHFVEDPSFMGRGKTRPFFWFAAPFEAWFSGFIYHTQTLARKRGWVKGQPYTAQRTINGCGARCEYTENTRALLDQSNVHFLKFSKPRWHLISQR